MKDFRVVFMGTPDFAVESLKAIVKSGVNVVGVVTTPDRQAGRGRKLIESAVKQYATTLNVPILQPEKLKDPVFVSDLEALQADLNVVVAFRMLPEVVWAMPPKGTINLHGSLLPQYRGAAPINWAVINGETVTGATTFFIDKEIDTGDMIDRIEIPIGSNDSVGKVHDELMVAGANLLANTVLNIAKGTVTKTSQAKVIAEIGELKHAPKIFKADCKIDWTESTTILHNFIRGLSPYPAAWTTIEKLEGKTLSCKIYQCSPTVESSEVTVGTWKSDNKTYLHIYTIDGYLAIEELQLEGKKRLPIADFLRGVKLDQFNATFV